MNKQRLKWIDGIRGLSCLLIFAHHFLIGFFPGAYFGTAATPHLSWNMDVYLSQSPLMWMLTGNYLVCIFCLISGLVLSYQIFHSDNIEKVSDALTKRYPRLMLPLVIISFAVFIMMKLSLFTNLSAAEITGSSWLSNFYKDIPSLKDVFLTSMITVWFQGNDTFSTAFWMLSTLFYGSFLSVILSLIGKNKGKKMILVYLLIALIYFRLNSLLLNFVLGTLLAYIMISFKKPVHRTLPGLLLLIPGLFLGGYPTGVVPDNIYSLLNHLPEFLTAYQFYHTLGAFMCVLGIYYLDTVSAFLGNKIFLFLGELSYAVYLIHIPVLFSFSTSLFIKLYSANSRYQLDALITFICSTFLILLLSWVFHITIEKGCSTVTNKIAKWISF